MRWIFLTASIAGFALLFLPGLVWAGSYSPGWETVALLGDAELLNLPDVELGETALETILNIVFLLLGAASVIFMIIGGLRYTMSAGDPQKIEQAKKTIIYALVGLVVAMLAYAMVDFVSSQVIG